MTDVFLKDIQIFVDNVQLSTDQLSYFKKVPSLQFARILEVIDNNLDDERFVHWIGQSNSTMWSTSLVENAARVLRRADAVSMSKTKVPSTTLQIDLFKVDE